MCRYMRLPIAFRDNQQISLADSTYERLSKLLHITKWLSQLPRVGSAGLLQTADTPCDLGTCLFSPFLYSPLMHVLLHVVTDCIPR